MVDGRHVDGQHVFSKYIFFIIFDCDLASVALASCELQSHSHLEVLREISYDFKVSVDGLWRLLLWLPMTYNHSHLEVLWEIFL